MAAREFRTVRCATPGVYGVVASTQRTFARHTHEEFGIGVVESGAQRSLSGRGPVEAGVGDAITVNPGEVHDGAPIGSGGRSWRILYFDAPLVQAAAEQVFEKPPRAFELRRPVMSDPRLASVLRALFAAEAGSDDSLRREELLLALVARCGRCRSPAARGVPASVTRAKRRIDDDPATPVSLGELAAPGGLSRFAFLRAFASATGMTPHAYVVQRRTDLVRRLLADGLSLSQAAADAGFCDQSHMTRTFVKKYGYTPGTWLQLISRRAPESERRR